jgi:hypothetical protein
MVLFHDLPRSGSELQQFIGRARRIGSKALEGARHPARQRATGAKAAGVKALGAAVTDL